MLGLTIRYIFIQPASDSDFSIASDKCVIHPGLDFLSVGAMKEYWRDQKMGEL